MSFSSNILYSLSAYRSK